MFRVRHFPFTPEGDGLTESGESSYRLTGWFIAGVGVVLLLIGLTW
ncbi:hypothetical protein [Natrononativus amylolyticus]|nr:hypothetical protein [Natrononativus amylolyticus]